MLFPNNAVENGNVYFPLNIGLVFQRCPQHETLAAKPPPPRTDLFPALQPLSLIDEHIWRGNHGLSPSMAVRQRGHRGARYRTQNYPWSFRIRA